MEVKFVSNMKVLNYKDKVVLVNMLNGLWIRISKLVYSIFCMAQEKKYTLGQLLNELYDDDDREYIRCVYKKMQEIGVLAEEKRNIKNWENRTVLFEVTRKCNLHCLHCCVDASSKEDFELSYNDIIVALQRIIEWNPSQITLTGGEPLLRQDIFEILQYTREKYCGKITLSTNGTLINSDNVLLLTKYTDQIDISVDGVDEETCSRVRGNGVFQKVIDAVELLHKNNYFNITLSMISDKFHGEMERLFEKLNEDLGTKAIIRTFAPTGRGKENENLLQGDQYYNPIPVINKKIFQACTCLAGESKILINYKGDIYPCQYFVEPEFVMGNILYDNISNLFAEEIVYSVKKFFPQNYERCKECPVNIFCWPCPGELCLYTKNGMENHFENICQFQKKLLLEKVWGEDVV